LNVEAGLFHADALEPLGLEIAEEEGDQEEEVDADEADVVAPIFEEVMIEAEGGVEGGGGEAAEEGADGDVDGADAGEAKDVVAEAEGDDVGEADGHDDKEAVVAEFFVESAEFGAFGFEFFVDVFACEPVGEIFSGDGGEGVADLGHEDAADEAETVAGEDLQPPDGHGEDGDDEIDGDEDDGEGDLMIFDFFVEGVGVVAEIVALFGAEEEDGAGDGEEDEEEEDEEASGGGAGHEEFGFYPLVPLAYMRFRMPVQ